MKLRLYHHPDGARVAYREAGSGPGLVLLHSALLSHREFEPIVEDLADRYRLILPDLPLHGDSEDRPRHPYTLDWLAEVIAAFCVETAGPRPLVGGHELGAQILLRALELRAIAPGRLVLMPNPLHRPAPREKWRAVARMGAVPGIDRITRSGDDTIRSWACPIGTNTVRLGGRSRPISRTSPAIPTISTVPSNSLAIQWSL